MQVDINHGGSGGHEPFYSMRNKNGTVGFRSTKPCLALTGCGGISNQPPVGSAARRCRLTQKEPPPGASQGGVGKGSVSQLEGQVSQVSPLGNIAVERQLAGHHGAPRQFLEPRKAQLFGRIPREPIGHNVLAVAAGVAKQPAPGWGGLT